MNLERFARTPLNKSDCPDECDFKKKNSPIIMIPGPDRAKIMLISRDPTKDFLPIHEYSKRFKNEDKRKMLFASAIPCSLITKSIKFLGIKPTSQEAKDLFKIFEVAYWTHLHKCATGSKEFKKKNGEACAKQWLAKEIRAGIRDGIRAIVYLGKDVNDCIESDRNTKTRNLKVIKLPHPSNQTNAIWSRSSSKYGKNIADAEKGLKELLNVLRE